LAIRLRGPQSFREKPQQFTGRFEDKKALSKHAFEFDLHGICRGFYDLPGLDALVCKYSSQRGLAPHAPPSS
jgi:hypothetical protein